MGGEINLKCFFSFLCVCVCVSYFLHPQEALTALKECARVLSYEPEVQPEGQLGIEAKEEIKMLQKWIKEEGWKY